MHFRVKIKVERVRPVPKFRINKRNSKKSFGRSIASFRLCLAWLFSMFRKLKSYLAWRRKKNFYSELIRRNDLCFDIGANVGEKTLLFLSLGAKVIAVEPQRACLPALESLKKKYPGRLAIVHKAVAEKKGRAQLHIGNVSQVSTLSGEFISYFGRHGALHWKEKEKVEVTTLDALVEEFGLPDFCKIDTEGYERKALEGLSRKINGIEFEFIPAFIHETKQCVEMLARFGTAEYNYNKYEQPFFELESWCGREVMKEQLDKLPAGIVHGNIFVRFVS